MRDRGRILRPTLNRSRGPAGSTISIDAGYGASRSPRERRCPTDAADQNDMGDGKKEPERRRQPVPIRERRLHGD